MDPNTAIWVNNLSKAYRLYDKPMDRVKESLHPFRRKYHKDFHALRDVSFKINKGETVAIIGRNGSGKSTLLKLVTGVLTPTSGAITINGRISALLELGAGFNPELTGIQNIFLYGSVIGYSREEIEDRLDDIVAFADIGEFVDQPVKLYSTGMFARLAFATYIHVDPDILIIDEVLAVGDIRFQLKCRDKLFQLRDRGTTILYVSHGNQGMADYAIMLEQGQIAMTGSLLDVWNYYHRLMTDSGDSAAKDQPGTTDAAAREPNGWDADATQQGVDADQSEHATHTEIRTGESDPEDTAEVTNRLRYRESATFLERVADLRFGTGEVRFVNTELLDQDDQLVRVATWGQKLFYRIHMRVDQDVPFISAGFMIRDSAGLHYLGDESWARRVPLLDLHAGDKIVLEFAFQVNFCHGQYTITPGSSYRNVEMPGEFSYFDWIDNCDILEVHPGNRPFHALYYVPTQITARIDRDSGRVPEDLAPLIDKYEKISCYP